MPNQVFDHHSLVSLSLSLSLTHTHTHTHTHTYLLALDYVVTSEESLSVNGTIVRVASISLILVLFLGGRVNDLLIE